eukprot:1075526-Pelagomonas_calceolata.AAC.1
MQLPSSGCHLLDTALHMLSDCQNHIISSMKTVRHNIAGRMIIKALSKRPWGVGLVNMDMGSGDRLAQHNRRRKEKKSPRQPRGRMH